MFITTVSELRSALMYDPKCSTTFPWCTINAPAAFAWCTINAPVVFAWCMNQKVEFSYIEWNGVHTLWLRSIFPFKCFPVFSFPLMDTSWFWISFSQNSSRQTRRNSVHLCAVTTQLGDGEDIVLSFLYNLTSRSSPRNYKKNYHQTPNMSRIKSQHLNASRRGLQLSLSNPLKPGVKSRMGM